MFCCQLSIIKTENFESKNVKAPSYILVEVFASVLHPEPQTKAARIKYLHFYENDLCLENVQNQ